MAALHLIERDLYERICSLWGAEIGRLQDNLSSGAISAVEFASCIDRLRNIYRLDQLGQLLANNPLIERDINELLATIRPVSSTNASEPANSGGQESRVEGDKV